MHRFAILALVAFALGTPAPWSPAQAPGRVYTTSNGAAGNDILSFHRAPDGSLAAAGTHATGGLGTGAGLGNQGGLALTDGGRFLLAVNAGSDNVTVFRVKRRGLVRTDVAPSGGKRPVSIAVHRHLVYVLNAGGSAANPDNVSGFRLTPAGKLQPIAGSTRMLSAAGTAPAQVGFSPRGDVLVVSEKMTDNLVTFAMARDVPGMRTVTPTAGKTPFGFGFSGPDELVVSEATGGGPSTVSSYRVGRDGSLTAITAALPITQRAACWIGITRNGRFGYTTNTASSSLTGLRIDRRGRLALLDANGLTAPLPAGSGPIDLAFSTGGRFLYVLNGASASLAVLAVGRKDGSLRTLSAATVNVPMGSNGLVAR